MRFWKFLIVSLPFVAIAHVSAQPDEALLRRWEKIQLQVAAASTSTDYLDFRQSITAWQYPSVIRARSTSYAYIDGDAESDISDATTIHIIGDLNANIHLHEQSNLVVAGDVSSSSNIYVNNLSAIFIGGKFSGTLHAMSAFNLHVGSDYEGHITIANGTGNSITVGGDFRGTLDAVTDNPKSVRINVHGFTGKETIDAIYQSEFVDLTSMFKKSDREPGIYHTRPPRDIWYAIEEQQN